MKCVGSHGFSLFNGKQRLRPTVVNKIDVRNNIHVLELTLYMLITVDMGSKFYSLFRNSLRIIIFCKCLPIPERIHFMKCFLHYNWHTLA